MDMHVVIHKSFNLEAFPRRSEPGTRYLLIGACKIIIITLAVKRYYKIYFKLLQCAATIFINHVTKITTHYRASCSTCTFKA